MNQEQIGQNIKRLRIKSNLTQEELAKKLYLSRQAISRWENGYSIPDYESIINISKIFNITIDDLLYGETLSKNSLNKYILNITNEKNKTKRKFNKLLIITIILLMLIILYYFLTTYNKNQIYEIKGCNEEIICNNSLLVITPSLTYFKTCDIKFIDDKYNIKIDTIKYYYVINNKDRLVMESGPSTTMTKDPFYQGIKFKRKEINQIINNFYVKVTTEDKKEYVLKLNLNMTYSNSTLLNPFTISNP